MATVFVGTLLTYLVLSAIPAIAAPASCTVNGADATRLDVALGTDEQVSLAVSDGSASFGAALAGEYAFTTLNSGTGTFPAFTSCGATATTALIEFVNVTGSDAGNERLNLFRPTAAAGENMVLNLGNGNDSFVLDYGGFASPPYTAPGFADPGSGDFPDLGTSTGGVLVIDTENAVPVDAEIRVDNAENVTVNGGDGNDFAAAGGAFSIVASPGGASALDDIPAAPNAWSAPLVFNGGNGLDILHSGANNDLFNGGAGDDLIAYSSTLGTGFTAPGPVTVDLGAATATGHGNDTLTDVQDATGSNFGDTMLGSSLDNVLNGSAGNDVIDGLGGNDEVNGDAGNDELRGGAGNDDVDGGADDDVIDEEAAANGADDLDGSGGFDILDYGARTTATVIIVDGGAVSGNDANGDGDAADAGDENDDVDDDFERYVTGSGNDTLVGDVGVTDEEFAPGAGNDSVDGNGGIDLLDQSDAPGAVTFNLETGTSTGHGNDTFAEIEIFASGAGDDVVIPDIQTGLPAGFDWFADGGIDTIDGSTNTGGFAVDLSNLGGPATCKAGPGLGLCTDVEDAIGGSGNDTLTGSAISNVLIGGAGFDSIAAGGGNDFVEGGPGNDSLAGGTGADFLSYVNAPSGVIVDMQLGFASGGDGDDAIGFFEIVLGSDFNDEIIGGQTFLDANLRVRGRGGNDVITGTNSSDTLAGGGGNDFVRAGGGDDTVRLGAGNDVGAGGSGDDVIRGAAGNDRLLGGGGDDFLFGGKGSDIGRGGGGNNTCRGVEDRRRC